jgi:hypothetical protein
MNEPNAAPQADNPGQTAEPTAANQGEQEEFDFKAGYQELKKQLGQLFGKYRNLESAVSQPKPDKPQQQDPEATTLRARLERIEAERQAEREEITRERRDASVQNAILKHGLSEEDAEILFDHIQARYGPGIKVEGRTVAYVDPTTGDPMPIQGLVDQVMKSKGAKFMPPAQVPGGRGLKPSNGGVRPKFVPYMELSPEERAKLTPQQTRDLVREERSRKP